MNDHEIAKRLADIIDLRVTEHVRGERLVWLIGGKQEWNPMEKIEQLWPLVKKNDVSVWTIAPGAQWAAECPFRLHGMMECAEGNSEISMEHAIALAIINAHNPSREGR